MSTENREEKQKNKTKQKKKKNKTKHVIRNQNSLRSREIKQ